MMLIAMHQVSQGVASGQRLAARGCFFAALGTLGTLMRTPALWPLPFSRDQRLISGVSFLFEQNRGFGRNRDSPIKGHLGTTEARTWSTSDGLCFGTVPPGPSLLQQAL